MLCSFSHLMIQNEDLEVLDLQDVTENWIKRNRLYMYKIKLCVSLLYMKFSQKGSKLTTRGQCRTRESETCYLQCSLCHSARQSGEAAEVTSHQSMNASSLLKKRWSLFMSTMNVLLIRTRFSVTLLLFKFPVNYDMKCMNIWSLVADWKMNWSIWKGSANTWLGVWPLT